ncbi:hypothetical protein GCM10010211_70150 [Streptomyces albospinus]|uniref:Uncharacterized protein n=1 Tax=Streptomyces albospinus TaxID=285515 RepID=A0ABQ2VKY3_9ACTN|nr:hypothetical protein [Streptomyces albospinus]GGU93286.1 hypothetical protein GCM10010211_70150 [Streptomyces albospinus]
MFRRSAAVLAVLAAAGILGTGAAGAAPVDHYRDHRGHHERTLTPREREGLRVAGHVLDSLFGGPPRDWNRY